MFFQRNYLKAAPHIRSGTFQDGELGLPTSTPCLSLIWNHQVSEVMTMIEPRCAVMQASSASHSRLGTTLRLCRSGGSFSCRPCLIRLRFFCLPSSTHAWLPHYFWMCRPSTRTWTEPEQKHQGHEKRRSRLCCLQAKPCLRIRGRLCLYGMAAVAASGGRDVFGTAAARPRFPIGFMHPSLSSSQLSLGWTRLKVHICTEPSIMRQTWVEARKTPE